MSPDQETMAISEFKATCLAVLKRVKRTGRSVLITRFGEPVAEIVPPSQPERARGWLGTLASRGQILGDVVQPAVGEEEWEVLK